MMINLWYEYTLSIPQHDELGIGLLRKLLHQADLSISYQPFRGLRLRFHALRLTSLAPCVQFDSCTESK